VSVRRVIRVGVAASTVAIALAIPAAAVAGGSYVVPAGFTTTGVLHGSGGFKEQLWENDRRDAKLTVMGHHAKTTYAVAGGPVADGRVSARLGKRGGFDLRFLPAGRTRRFKVQGNCEGAPYRFQRGYLVGHFAFRGERDYTRARGRRIPAARESWPALRCEYVEGRREHHPLKEPRLRVAGWTYEGRGVYFDAALFHRDGRPADQRVEYLAQLSGRAGQVSIQRKVTVAAPEDGIAFPGLPQVPEEVAVGPPAPFTGSAEFLRTHESTFTWTGDLAVDFPGLGRVRLAGPRFGARLCTLEGCISREPERSDDL
jgi:hypothetical protein